MRVLVSVCCGALAKTSSTFLAIGDWGGGLLHSTTPAEEAVGRGMQKVAQEADADYVLALGDNFYPLGIHFWNHFRFNETFEDVFDGNALGIDWFVIAGNHDHYGDVQAQLDYTKKSARWQFPALFYSFTKPIPGGKTAQFVMLDSYTLSGMSFYDEATGEPLRDAGPPDAAHADAQWKWVEQQLADSSADYLFTASHYPVWSVCTHGPTADLVTNLRPLLQKYNVTAHLAGHDHCMQHIEEAGIQYINSGAGSLAWYPTSNRHKIGNATLSWHMADDNRGEHTGGFASVEMDREGVVVRYHAEDGAVQYETPKRAPRSPEQEQVVM